MLVMKDVVLNKRLKFILKDEIIEDVVSSVVPRIGECVNINNNFYKVENIIYNFQINKDSNSMYMIKKIEYKNNYVGVYLKE